MLNYRHVSEVWKSTAELLTSPPRGVSLSWWPKLTDALGGLRPNELTLLCAPTGAGKTQLLANLSAQLLMQNEPQFVAPVETGDSDYLNRVLSCLEEKDLNTGAAFPKDYVYSLRDKWARSVFEKKFLISTHQDRVKIDEMIMLLKYMHQEYGVTVALLDNLNFFLDVVSSQMEKAEMDSAIQEFVILAKQIPMHVILVVHPKKTDHGRVISEFDIKGSSTAVQEASNVILFNRAESKDIESRFRHITDRELTFRKVRKRGISVGKSIWFAYNNGRFEEFLR